MIHQNSGRLRRTSPSTGAVITAVIIGLLCVPATSQAEDIIRQGGQWLDVRLPSEFENQHLDGAINIPLYFIRLKISTLDQDKKYIVCCDTGRRSSAGAYILSERGYQAFVLQGGINSETA